MTNEDNQILERVEISKHYIKQPIWKRIIAIFLIYLPILTTIPFVILGAIFIKAHLKYIGAHKIKDYSDFLPSRNSYRYNLKNQISTPHSFLGFGSLKFLWIFNCNMYCTYSIALFAYVSYLIRIIENWWCPFNHSKKHTYSMSAIDKSFWHSYPHLVTLLDDKDKNNVMWNEDVLENKNNE